MMSACDFALGLTRVTLSGSRTFSLLEHCQNMRDAVQSFVLRLDRIYSLRFTPKRGWHGLGGSRTFISPAKAPFVSTVAIVIVLFGCMAAVYFHAQVSIFYRDLWLGGRRRSPCFP